MRALIEEKDDGYDDGEGRFEYHIHVFEQIEDQFQVDIFQLYELGIWYAVPALFGHPERFRDEFAG